jgi:hypothetical protein
MPTLNDAYIVHVRTYFLYYAYRVRVIFFLLENSSYNLGREEREEKKLTAISRMSASNKFSRRICFELKREEEKKLIAYSTYFIRNITLLRRQL